MRDPCRGGSGSRYTWRKISIASPSALKAEKCCRQRLYATAGNEMVEGAVERFRMEFGVEKRGVASRSPGRTRGEDRRETCVCKINYLLNSIYSKGGVKNASMWRRWMIHSRFRPTATVQSPGSMYVYAILRCLRTLLRLCNREPHFDGLVKDVGCW